MAVYTTIDNPELYHQSKTYSGTGSSQAITLDGDENMQPDMIWLKSRTNAEWHVLYDSARGAASNYKQLYPNDGNVEVTPATSGLTAIGTDGFTLGANDNSNNSSETFVAWCWKESADAGFDMVLYTGNATADQDHSHSLSAVPHVIIVKNRDNTNNESWAIYHHKNTSAPETDRLYLNSSGATGDDIEFWQDTVPTSSVFTIGRQDVVNTSSGNHIAYLWSEKQGYSKFGSYTGNGNADGTFIYLGFRPAWVMMKRTDTVESWHIFDNKRDVDNVIERRLEADSSGAEHTTIDWCDFLSNGIKHRYSGTNVNASGGTFVYMAFAEAPFVNSNGVPANAR